MPIVNQWPSVGGFNFMVICTNLLLLMGRALLEASFHFSGECDVLAVNGLAEVEAVGG